MSCCSNPVTFSASNFGTANVFNWTISGGTYTGSGSSITVTPVVGNGSVIANCIVSRSSGLSTYTRSSGRTVSRTARTATYTVSNPPVITYTGLDYLCKGSGRVFSITSQCGLETVTWSAPNCTISGQGTINATITPNSTVANGSTIDISAVVSYVGSCIASTQVTRFAVFDGGNTIPPVGTVSISANPPNVPLQNTSEWLTSFTMQKGTSINYNNGIFVLNPTVLQVESYGRTATVEICYLNVCGGNQSCVNFQVWVPGIVNWNPYRMANPKGDNKIEPQKLNTVFPNPTNGLITIAFEKNMNGTYQIFDINAIGICGGSYGGTMVLGALAFYPDEFKVGVNAYGVANWLRTLRSIPTYWESERKAIYDEMGDPNTIDSIRLKNISPIYNYQKITKPLLVFQGLKDVRVLPIESDEIVAGVKKNNVPVEYVVFPEEGHGFNKKENQITTSKRTLKFLDKYMKPKSK